MTEPNAIVGDGGRLGYYAAVARWPAILLLFVSALAVATILSDPYQMDFVSFWAASTLAVAGDVAAAYDSTSHAAAMETAGISALLPFAYPPHFLLLLMPLGFLSYGTSAAFWVVGTLVVYFAAVRRLAPRSGWAPTAFPPLAVNAITGQTGFLTAGLFIGGLSLLRQRPFAAGILLGALVIKPHLGILLPFALAAGREWRAIAGAAVSSLGLCLLGLLAFGPDAYAAWFRQAPLFASIVSEGLAGWHKMASIYASLRLAGVAEQSAWIVHAFVAVAAAMLACSVWFRSADDGAKASALAAATALASPYFYLYDALILIVPFLWLATVESNRIVLPLLWFALLAGVAQNWILNDAVNATPFVSIILLLRVWRHASSGPARASIFRDPPVAAHGSAA